MAPDIQSDESIGRRPDVIVEFLFDRGALSIAVRNIGSSPAVNVAVAFDRPIVGLGGARDISALAVFRNIEFLGPGREISAFVDTSHSYFAREQPRQVSARISYRDRAGCAYEETIRHDLEVYRELPFLVASDRAST